MPPPPPLSLSVISYSSSLTRQRSLRWGNISVQSRKLAQISLSLADVLSESSKNTTKQLTDTRPAERLSRLSPAMASLHDAILSLLLKNNWYPHREPTCLRAVSPATTNFKGPTDQFCFCYLYLSISSVGLLMLTALLSSQPCTAFGDNLGLTRDSCPNYFSALGLTLISPKYHTDGWL